MNKAAQILDGVILQMQDELQELLHRSKKSGMYENPVFRATLNKVIDNRLTEIAQLKEAYNHINLLQ